MIRSTYSDLADFHLKVMFVFFKFIWIFTCFLLPLPIPDPACLLTHSTLNDTCIWHLAFSGRPCCTVAVLKLLRTAGVIATFWLVFRVYLGDLCSACFQLSPSLKNTKLKCLLEPSLYGITTRLIVIAINSFLNSISQNDCFAENEQEWSCSFRGCSQGLNLMDLREVVACQHGRS